MKRLFCVLIIVCFTLSLAACGNTQGSDFEKHEIDIYYKTIDCKETLEVYYKNENNQIPYVSLDTYRDISNRVYNEGIGDYPKDEDYKLTTSYEKDKAVLSRENGSDMTFDFTKNEIRFDNYDLFVAHSYDKSPLELLHMTGYDEEGSPVYIDRVEEDYSYTDGEPITIDLNKYNIDIVYENNNYYIPLQTLADLLINMQYCHILYNTNAIFVIDYDTTYDENEGGQPGLIAKYYEDKTNVRTQELIEYTYNELCLFLDYNYGFKEEHKIDSFDKYLSNTINQGKSLKEYLKSENPFEFEMGMSFLTNVDFNDLHSGYYFSSSYAGRVADEVKKKTSKGTSREAYEIAKNDLKQLKEEAFPDGIKQYQEIGNTAFIYMKNNFAVPKVDYYKEEATIDAEDTIGLMIYAYKQIYRKNSPIDNVVLDLSDNRGGCEDALAYTCGMFTGEYTFTLVNPITNSVSNSRYRIDANLDHKFDERDLFYDKNLYCLTSPVSFSCANACASILSENKNVTMLGRSSGGGSCIVCAFTTASGGWYKISGNKKIYRNHMNSYYNVDDGAPVDYRFDNIEDYYNREAIVRLINGRELK